jgi:transcription initiation factor TFIIB
MDCLLFRVIRVRELLRSAQSSTSCAHSVAVQQPISIIIDWEKLKDASGRSLSADKRRQMYPLREWQERIQTKDAGERNLQFALGEIDRIASTLGVLRSVREIACVIYWRALAEDRIRGRPTEGVATACLYTACRKEGIPRNLQEDSEVSRVGKTEISRTYRYLS